MAFGVKRLLSEANLSLAKAIEFALSSEAAEKNAQELKGAEQLCVGQVAQASANVKPCYCCGYNHMIAATKNRSATHAVKRDTWPKSAVQHDSRWAHSHLAEGVAGRDRGNTKWVDTAEGEEDEPPASILAVGRRQSPPLTVSIELNGVPVTMEVDAEATVSLMSEQKRQLFPQALLEKPTVRLTTYTTESIAVVGQMTVQVSTSATLRGIHCM